MWFCFLSVYQPFRWETHKKFIRYTVSRLHINWRLVYSLNSNGQCEPNGFLHQARRVRLAVANTSLASFYLAPYRSLNWQPIAELPKRKSLRRNSINGSFRRWTTSQLLAFLKRSKVSSFIQVWFWALRKALEIFPPFTNLNPKG